MILLGLQWKTRSIGKHVSRVSYILNEIGHQSHRSGYVLMAFFALRKQSSRNIGLVLYCLLFLCMSLARDSTNGGFVVVLWYLSWILSHLLMAIMHMMVPSDVCMLMCDCFVGYCVS